MSELQIDGETGLELARAYLIGEGVFGLDVGEDAVIQYLAARYSEIEQEYPATCIHPVTFGPSMEIGPLNWKSERALAYARSVAPPLNSDTSDEATTDYLSSVYLKTTHGTSPVWIEQSSQNRSD
ncbi:hypothetical protein [Halococcus salsus]|uniref:hypothetical protein n=1 Tax=Halococcus salsus TaxID=2162894 RepID=UPI00135CBC25|nr:hypothetical protein [Halococcus salsus]